MRVLISTNSPNVWVVPGDDKVCEGSKSNAEKTDCVDSRGRLFYSKSSSTWKDIGTFNFWYESNLGYTTDGKFGSDNITLGTSDAPRVGSHVVGGMDSDTFWLGQWGINPAPTNFTAFDHPVPSMLQVLKNTGQIPSLSYGFTAGSRAEALSKSYSDTLDHMIIHVEPDG